MPSSLFFRPSLSWGNLKKKTGWRYLLEPLKQRKGGRKFREEEENLPSFFSAHRERGEEKRRGVSFRSTP